MQRGFGDDVDTSAEQLLGVHRKTAEREPATAGRQHHEQGEVAVVTAIAACHGVEDAHALDAAAPGEREQLGAVSFDQGCMGVQMAMKRIGLDRALRETAR